MANWRTPFNGCPLCEGNGTIYLEADCSQHALYKKPLPQTITWLRCDQCGHIYTSGYFTKAALELVFSDAHANQTPGVNVEQDRFTWADVVASVSSIRKSYEGRWLDVGFGSGNLLLTAMEFGYEALGIDLRESSVNSLRTFGLQVSCSDLLDLEVDSPVDVISMADVLEHMPFPKPALQRAHEILGPNGTLFLSMPNIDAPLWKILDLNSQNPYWGELEHYHNFGRVRLIKLLEEHGFKFVHYNVSKRYRSCMEVIATKI